MKLGLHGFGTTGKDLQSRQRDHCVWIWIGLSLMSGIRATSPNSSTLPVVSIVVQHGICSTAADSLVSNNCHTTDVVSVHVRRRSTRRWRPLLWTYWAGAGSAEPTAEHRAGNAQVKLSAAPRRRRTESCHWSEVWVDNNSIFKIVYFCPSLLDHLHVQVPLPVRMHRSYSSSSNYWQTTHV